MRPFARLLAGLVLLAPLLCFADATVPNKDLPGAKDPAWLKRYEGSFIVSYEQRRFDAVEFPASKLLVDMDSEERDPSPATTMRQDGPRTGAWSWSSGERLWRLPTHTVGISSMAGVDCNIGCSQWSSSRKANSAIR